MDEMKEVDISSCDDALMLESEVVGHEQAGNFKQFD